MFTCKTFWPRPEVPPSAPEETEGLTWPKRAHPGALSEAGRARAPWLTSWARPTFEQGCLSVLPHLEGPCWVASLPGEHLFQASKIQQDRMRPVIFHAFGRAKLGAKDALKSLEQQGWETLPIAILGMPHLPPAWSHDVEADRRMQVLRRRYRPRRQQWRSIPVRRTELFPEPPMSALNNDQTDSELVSVHTPSETGAQTCARQPLQAADQNSSESGSRTNKEPETPREVLSLRSTRNWDHHVFSSSGTEWQCVLLLANNRRLSVGHLAARWLLDRSLPWR